MKKLFHFALVLFLAVALTGCGAGSGTGNDVIRSAQDTPEAFNLPTGMEWGSNSCKNPLLDPIDGTELIMVRSSGGFGDYRVTSGKYGVGRGELLRINCNTGSVVGIVEN